MKLVNTRDRSFNGIKMGEEVELKDKDQIAEYIEAGFEEAGKEEIKAVVKDAEVKKEAGKEEIKAVVKDAEVKKETGKEEIKAVVKDAEVKKEAGKEEVK